MRALALLGVALAASVLQVGCATVGRQTREVLKSPPSGIPAAVVLDQVPFVNQEAGHCGPATLTMALRWTGDAADVERVISEVYTPSMKGSLQSDMLSAARRHARLAVAVETLPDLLREVAAGNPVIVFENLGLSWYPRWHYALVVGYDLPAQQMVLHSGPKAFERVDLTRFEYAWNLAQAWAVVVLPPNRSSATGTELAHLKGAAGLEQAGQVAAADQAYATMLKRWPESLGALIGLANQAYKRGDFKGAVGFLKKATQYHPTSITARHNLSVAEDALKR
ncbi:MAG: PA2778 family cysteine peptidase [Bdellovibrionales bacterium]|nr:PA2778 family cysteine peptidase [Bdellovibrionales bacterium]